MNTTDHHPDETPLSAAELAIAEGRRLFPGPRIYLAGPMTGLPDFNYPAFNREAARLRDLGYDVENPAENPENHDKRWETYMRLAIPQMLTCDMVAVLPGAALSRGAVVEISLARQLAMPVVDAASIRQKPIHQQLVWDRPAAA